jgi:hypothetical protein
MYIIMVTSPTTEMGKAEYLKSVSVKRRNSIEFTLTDKEVEAVDFITLGEAEALTTFLNGKFQNNYFGAVNMSE